MAKPGDEAIVVDTSDAYQFQSDGVEDMCESLSPGTCLTHPLR